MLLLTFFALWGEADILELRPLQVWIAFQRRGRFVDEMFMLPAG